MMRGGGVRGGMGGGTRGGGGVGLKGGGSVQELHKCLWEPANFPPNLSRPPLVSLLKYLDDLPLHERQMIGLGAFPSVQH